MTLDGALTPACAVAALAGFAAWRRDAHPRWAQVGQWTGTACLLLVSAAWLARWHLAGHLPLFGTYESALSLAVAVLAATAGAALRMKLPMLWPAGCAVTTLLLAHGLRFDPTAFPLTISERSWVVDAHAVLAWGAFGCLSVNAAAALAHLAGPQHWRSGGQRLLVFSLSLGFLLHSAMLATGSFYKFLLFGQTWSFDPVETLGLVAWMAYGTLLHLQQLAAWEGRRLATWCLALFALLVFSYRGLVYFPAWSTYHIFDMDLRLHVTPSSPVVPGGAP